MKRIKKFFVQHGEGYYKFHDGKIVEKSHSNLSVKRPKWGGGVGWGAIVLFC